MCILNLYEQPYYMCIQIIISLNNLDIMVTLINVYFEYIKFLCKIFVKYILPIYKFIQTIYYTFKNYSKLNLSFNCINMIWYDMFIFNTYDPKKLNFNIILD
jgi:hypothetical protein